MQPAGRAQLRGRWIWVINGAMDVSGGLPLSGLHKGPAKASLLVVVGADRDMAARADGRRRIGGSTDLWRLLPETVPFDELHLNKRLLRQSARPDLLPYDRILNVVTDPDQNPEMLEALRKLLRGYRGKVFNPPEAVLRSTRDQVAGLLSGIDGLRVPRTIRLRTTKSAAVASAVERAGLQFPAILRVAGTHMGEVIGLVGGMDELISGLAEGGEHILTEFVDFRSEDGLYRKYRVYFFGRHIVLRHMIASDRWNIHVSERGRFMGDHLHLRQEELRLFARPDAAFAPAVLAAFKGVRERMPLDFFGLDFGMTREGEVVLFEANATMSFFPLFRDPRFAYVHRCVAPAQRAFRAMVDEG